MDTIPLGGVIPLVVLLPNLAALLYPPVPAQAGVSPRADPEVSRFEMIERVGQAAVFCVPFFYPLSVSGYSGWVSAAFMIVCLGFYYAGWLRYLRQGRLEALLYLPMWGIPLPMALLPVLYFLSASVLLQSLPLAIASAVFAAGHIYVSRESYVRLGDKERSGA